MKTQEFKSNGSGQGQPTSDRAFNDQKAMKKQTSISNSGSQRSNQTSSRDGSHQPKRSSKTHQLL